MPPFVGMSACHAAVLSLERLCVAYWGGATMTPLTKALLYTRLELMHGMYHNTVRRAIAPVCLA